MDLHETFVALDFETANQDRDSACAVAAVRVEGGEIVAERNELICPATSMFRFTYIHGITPDDVADAPAFHRAWEEIEPLLRGAAFIAAHNAPFDRSVLRACCRAYVMEEPSLPFVCTVKLARRTWGLYPTTLPDVCRALDIPLVHHDPLSDARACARIVIAATSRIRSR